MPARHLVGYVQSLLDKYRKITNILKKKKYPRQPVATVVTAFVLNNNYSIARFASLIQWVSPFISP